MAKHFDGLIDNSIRNGLQMNLKDAIEDAGAKVPSTACLWQYPEIIRKNLISKTISGVNFLGKDVINIYSSIEDGNYVYNIATAYDTKRSSRPNYSEKNPNWGNIMSIDEVFDDLFAKILPAVKGVHAGDITITDKEGNDLKQWNNTLFNKYGFKNGLLANSKYLRLYLTCQPEPLYIYIDGSIGNLSNGYNVKDSDTVHFELDDEEMTMSAHIARITQEQIDNIK